MVDVRYPRKPADCTDKTAAEWIAENYPPEPKCAEPPSAPAFSIGEVGDLASCSDWHGDLKLWLVERAGKTPYDECNALVIIAATEADARLAFPAEPHVRAKAHVTCVGLALPGAQAGTVICRDDLES